MLHKIQLPPDTNWAIQFRRKNMMEVWGPELRFKTIKNTLPPVKPSKPTAISVLAQLVITWDGQSADGSKYLPDLNRIEVHVGISADFVPSSATMVDQFSIAGSTQQRQASDLNYNTTYYVKLVAVNNSNIRSEPSDEAHATIKRLSGIELEDGSINIDKTNFSNLDRLIGQQAVYYEPEPPTKITHPGNPPFWNDLWYDSNDKYRMYRYQHSTGELTQGTNESREAFYQRNQTADLTWQEIPIGTANQSAGSRTFFAATDPAPTTTPAVANGDVWYKTSSTGSTPYIRQGGVWVQLQFGQGVLGPGSVVADNIVSNTITSDKIKANSITSNEIATGTILAGNIHAGAITSDAIGTNTIITRSANIGTGVIDSASIGSLDAGKITTGTLTAKISVTTGLIRTAISGARAEFDTSGIRLYNSDGAITMNASASTGYMTVTGNIIARTFRSQGFLTGGTGYIELGDTGPVDPTDEVRMYMNGSISSMRNPTDRPGFVRLSTSTQGTRDYIGVYDFGPSFAYIPGGIGRNLSANITFSNTSTIINGGQNGGLIRITPAGNVIQSLFIEASDSNSILLRNGASGFRKVTIKLPQNEERVQIRNGDDNGYGDLIVRNIQITGTQTGGNAGGGTYPTNASFTNITTNGLTVYNTVSAYGYTTTGAVTAYNVETTGNVYSRYEIYADNNITSRSTAGFYAINGAFYSRNGYYSYSNPDRKTNVKKLNLDALSLLANTEMYAWDWAPGEDDVEGQPGIGLMTSELPYIATPDALDEGSNGLGDNYNLVVTGALTVQAVRQLAARVVELETKLAAMTPEV